MPTLTRHWYDRRPSLERLEGVSASTADGERVVDLQGRRHSLGELHLSLQDHSWVIRNGTLADGDILVGPRIEGRRVALQNVTLDKVRLHCTDELSCEVVLDNCTEIKDCRIQADRLSLSRCKSIERTELVARELGLRNCWSLRADAPLVVPVSGRVRIESDAGELRTKLRNIEFKGVDGRLEMSNAALTDCRVTGKLETGRFSRCEFHNCRLAPITSSWSETETTHTAVSRRAGLWQVNVRGRLELREVTFETLTVDSEVIANQCENRAGVDIQNAAVDNEWEVLRDNYTGTLLAFHLLFLAAFVAPLFSKMAAAAGVAGLTYQAQALGLVEWPMMPVWEVLLFGFYGTDSTVGWVHALLTVGLLVYNMARIYLTVTIVKLRAREEHLQQQNFRRARPAAHKYQLKSLLHRLLMKPLLVLAVVSALWKVWDAISIQIPIPPAT
jgi:hypothetical protein